ncbi:MAG: MmgE/PrpD family protein [Candidatus Rokubacteria bacterium]|nr:MmgE/PrpD family protein [Candidatus Rokubacteria bacterium]
MTLVEQLAAFVTRASHSDLSETAREQLKIRVLDSLGCAIAALDGEPLRMIRIIATFRQREIPQLSMTRWHFNFLSGPGPTHPHRL